MLRFSCVTTLNFYPRPPRGGRHSGKLFTDSDLEISIHALREEGDPRYSGTCTVLYISIHALREEGDKRISALIAC